MVVVFKHTYIKSNIMQASSTIIITLLLTQIIVCMAMQKPTYFIDTNRPESEIADYIFSKGYLPKENDLPLSSVVKNEDNDVTYLLSKLSDEELMKLLNEHPIKNSYDLNDIVQIALGGKTQSSRIQYKSEDFRKPKSTENNRIHITKKPQKAFYKLEHKEILAKDQKNDQSFLALNKLKELLYNRSKQDFLKIDMNDEKKELLFDILIAQLKMLCCKSTPKMLKPQLSNLKLKSFLKKYPPRGSQEKSYNSELKPLTNQKPNEYMFLIVNDEIKNNEDDELILVNPDTLERNSSILLLGPVTTPLSDNQLKLVMNRISNELSKPEYTSLLQQLSDGTLNNNNINLMKNFIFGPETRRYIKAHRCNHQSKLSKVYGGPKWLICTGYININTPSLYD